MSENVIDLEMDDDEERRGVKRPPDDDNNFATIQMCVNCKQESDYFVPVSCCHVFCSDCYTQLFAELQPDSEARCPEDGKIIIPDFDTINNLSGGHEVVPKMRMPCRHKDRGCEKMVFFQEMKEHVDSCVFRLLNCPYNCKDKVIFKNLTDHLINHCECRLTKCNFCVDNIPLNTKKEHEDKCPNKPITCQYCNLENILLKEMAHHIENCPMSPSVCVMRRMGCSFEGTKKRTEEHQQDWPIHLQVLVNCLSSLQKDVHDLAARFDALDQNRLNAQAATESIPASQVLTQNPKRRKGKSALCQDGIFLWQLKKFSDCVLYLTKMNSPHFYINQQGYHMRLELLVEKKEIALRVFVEDGDYDETLSWPFEKKMRVIVLNQYCDVNHIVEMDPKLLPQNFRPEESKGSKWAATIPLMETEDLLSKDSGYLVNDTLSVKFQVFK